MLSGAPLQCDQLLEVLVVGGDRSGKLLVGRTRAPATTRGRPTDAVSSASRCASAPASFADCAMVAGGRVGDVRPGGVGGVLPPVRLQGAQTVERDGALVVDLAGLVAEHRHPLDAERRRRPRGDQRDDEDGAEQPRPCSPPRAARGARPPPPRRRTPRRGFLRVVHRRAAPGSGALGPLSYRQPTTRPGSGPAVSRIEMDRPGGATERLQEGGDAVVLVGGGDVGRHGHQVGVRVGHGHGPAAGRRGPTRRRRCRWACRRRRRRPRARSPCRAATLASPDAFVTPDGGDLGQRVAGGVGDRRAVADDVLDQREERLAGQVLVSGRAASRPARRRSPRASPRPRRARRRPSGAGRRGSCRNSRPYSTANQVSAAGGAARRSPPAASPAAARSSSRTSNGLEVEQHRAVAADRRAVAEGRRGSGASSAAGGRWPARPARPRPASARARRRCPG